ncbi:MAG: chromate transporter [Acetobacteraceae bacterium]|nr:chromate transporter [Acetobacteraceae bacterium]MBV8523376.1 chromate transporter [Acetobacteraceae bacterium]MBV8589040.1 chromate transporter [Acetobacteraceae bacterium]
MKRLAAVGAKRSEIGPSVSLAALFAGFFRIGMIGFGGVLPWARRMLVEQRKWLTAQEFTDLLALCQFLPGPNVVNLAVAVGWRYAGVAGSVVCFTGLIAAPMAIVIGLGAVYSRYAQLTVVQHGFAAMAAAASGLVLSTAFKIAAPLRSRPVGIATAAITFAIVGLVHVPLLLALIVLVPVSIWIAWCYRE